MFISRSKLQEEFGGRTNLLKQRHVRAFNVFHNSTDSQRKPIRASD